MISSKSRRRYDTATLFHVMLPGLVTFQAALCAAQCSFWHALLQYSYFSFIPARTWLVDVVHGTERCVATGRESPSASQ